MHTGRLSPERTIYIDGTFASRYIEPVHLGLGLMLGEIHSFNRELWQKIVKEIVQVTERALLHRRYPERGRSGQVNGQPRLERRSGSLRIRGIPYMTAGCAI